MNWLDLLIAVSIAIGLIKGLFDGFIRQVISLISLVGAIFFAGKVASFLRTVISSSAISENIPGYFLTGICYIFAFSLIIFAFRFLGNLLESIIKRTPVAPFNNILGGFLGGITIAILLSLIFNVLTVFDPNSQLISKQTRKESVLFNKVVPVVPFLYPFLRNYLEGPVIFPEPKKPGSLKEQEVWI